MNDLLCKSFEMNHHPILYTVGGARIRKQLCQNENVKKAPFTFFDPAAFKSSITLRLLNPCCFDFVRVIRLKTFSKKLNYSETRGLVAFCLQALGDEMARSDFHWGAEDWEVFGPGQLKLYEKGGVLYGSDAGRTVWYFSAPAKFLGDK